LLEVWC